MQVTPPHRRGFPCCGRFPFTHMPTPIPRRNRRVLVVVRFPCDGGLPQIDGGSASAIAFRGLLSVHYTFRPVCSPGRPRRPSTPKYFSGFVTSSAAPIATGRNDSCRVGFSPTENRRLCTAYAKDRTHLPIREPLYHTGPHLSSPKRCHGRRRLAAIPAPNPRFAAPARPLVRTAALPSRRDAMRIAQHFSAGDTAGCLPVDFVP